MPRRHARARRKPAVRLTAITCVPLLVLHAQEEVVAGDAGIVDEDVERAERGLGRRDQCLDRRPVGEIAGSTWARSPRPAGQVLERRAAGAGEGDRRALAVQRLGDRAADAARWRR